MDNENPVDFTQVFSDEAINAIKGTVLAFLKQQGNAQNASLEYPDKTVYLHAHKGDIEIHIVDGDRPAPEFPDEDDDEE